MNPLTDVLPPQVRKYVYAVLALAAICLACYQASGGDWLEFAGLVLGALGFGTAASNTPQTRTTSRTVPNQRGASDVWLVVVVALLVLILLAVLGVLG